MMLSLLSFVLLLVLLVSAYTHCVDGRQPDKVFSGLDTVSAVTADRNGFIYVANFYKQEIVSFSPSGQQLLVIPLTDLPFYIAVNSKSAVAFADGYGKRITFLSPQGHVTGTMNNSDFGIPNGVFGPLCYDSADTLYVTLWATDTLYTLVALTADKQIKYKTSSLPRKNSYVISLAVDENGSINLVDGQYGVSGARIIRFDSESGRQTSLTNLTSIRFTLSIVAFDRSGNAYIYNATRDGFADTLSVFDPNGNFVKIVNLPKHSIPYAMGYRAITNELILANSVPQRIDLVDDQWIPHCVFCHEYSVIE